MKAKYLLLIPVLLGITSCNLSPVVSNSSSNENSSFESSKVEDSSNMTSTPGLDSSKEESNPIQSSPIESSPLEDSSSKEDNSSEIESTPSIGPIDVSEKEYFKSLVNREKLTYSDDFVNDPNHNVTALEIFQLNDTHGAYLDGEDIVGISRVQSTIKAKTNDPYAVVKIANGDMLQGTAFSNMLLGEPGIAALNEMDFDCFTIGNHEFDWGFDNLAVYKDGDLSNGELECPFLGANIFDGNNQRPDWIEPYTIVNKGNVKVGIIGVIGENLENSISKVSLGDYHFESSVEAVNKYSKILLEEEKVDILIVSDHSHNEFINQQYANNVEVDCIINGHDHQRVEEYVSRYDGKMVPVIESNTKNYNIGKVTIQLDSNKDMSSYYMNHYYPEDYEEDAKLKSLMDVYNEITSTYENEVIGVVQGGLTKQAIAEVTCTYIAAKYDADIAMMNAGGVRTNISANEITNGLVYEALPFDNELYIAYLKGDELYRIVSGSGYYYNKSGLGNGTNVLLNKIDKTKTYKVVCVDYVATKTFFLNYFNEDHGLIKTGDYIRDCALEAIKEKY